jgi:BirA family biotin operon repressor/biotin-[acetyl-CoA-carboxylase] ligase
MTVSTRARIVAELRSSDGFVSGHDLAERLGVSRTAVWKHVAALKDEGYTIETERGHGYRLVALPGGLTEGEIVSALTTAWVGKTLVCKVETGSTNSDAAQLGRSAAADGTVVVADSQTAGRGRLGRTWISRPGMNLYLSVLLRPKIVPAAAPQLALVAGLAVAEALEQEGLEPTIKWPNDVLLGGRKVCGILTELEAEADRVEFVVVGIGVNLNSELADFPPELHDRATSVLMSSGKTVDRARFAAVLLAKLEACYERFRTDGFGALAEGWASRSALAGKEITVDGAGGIVKGMYAGIDSEGALLLKEGGADGQSATTRRVLAGDVTILGGYT